MENTNMPFSIDEINKYFEMAEEQASYSNCLKCASGAVVKEYDNDNIIGVGWKAMPEKMGSCKKCNFECKGIHSAERAILDSIVNAGAEATIEADIFLTNGPCDRCMRMLVEMDFSRVFFKNPCDTDFSEYKGCIDVFEGTEQKRLI